MNDRPSLHVAPGRLAGRITPPASKSVAHRALICAALAGDPALVSGIGTPSDDIRVTQAAMAALLESNDANNPVVIDCRESGTTLRLLVPIAAALGRSVTFIGQGRLPERPLRAYETALRDSGASLEFPDSGSLPLTVRGQLRHGTVRLPGDVSSQYVSGLLLALPLLQGDSRLLLTSPLQSAPYVDLTVEVMARFGVFSTAEVADPEDRSFGGFSISGGQLYRPTPYVVEADYSQAAFWMTANHLGSRIELTGLPDKTKQGDRVIGTWLDRLARVGDTPDGMVEIDVSQIPDLVPILAVAAAFGPAETRIVNAARLRMKESDRLEAVEQALRSIGADIEQTEDGLVIHGRQSVPGGRADACNDHRIAMAMAIAALRTTRGVEIVGPACVEKSYPGFFNDLIATGGVVT